MLAHDVPACNRLYEGLNQIFVRAMDPSWGMLGVKR